MTQTLVQTHSQRKPAKAKGKIGIRRVIQEPQAREEGERESKLARRAKMGTMRDREKKRVSKKEEQNK